MKTLFSLILLFASFFAGAQTPDPVKWQFWAEKESDGQTYTLYAKASITPGWHVFSLNPGGDGLLIPTGLTIENREQYRDVGALTVEGKEVRKEMEGMGMVSYYEYEAVFKLSLIPYKPGTASGFVSFQVCNDRMCLPPAEVPFSVKL
jgi:hypothetical protein